MRPYLFFAKITAGEFRWANNHAVAFADRYPVGGGHTLGVSRRHQSEIFHLNPTVRAAAWNRVDDVHRDLSEELDADGFNIGLTSSPTRPSP